MQLKVIRDELQYATALEEAQLLAASDPPKQSAESDRLELLAVLIEKFESERFFIEKPDPIDALLYRMADLDLRQKDLADMIGSKSRASEILSRKRPLTLDMIRLLHDRLRIPVELLIGAPKDDVSMDVQLDWEEFPVREMRKRGWISDSSSTGAGVVDLVRDFIAKASLSSKPVLLRRSLSGTALGTGKYALFAWIARVLILSREHKRSSVKYAPGSITDEFLQQVAKLSVSEKGPLLAQEFLAMKGVVLVVEPHLSKTKLDGAAMLDGDGTPVIGLTLRYDRIDNFWFTLMHELVHVQRHLNQSTQAFVDCEENDSEDIAETEADLIAGEAFIPRNLWKRSIAYRTKRAEDVIEFANELRIHPALVAGRLRKETGNYRILSKLVSTASYRDLFPGAWTKD
jgi:HTH-type transcriptional regulator / antitoxin HigA